MPYGFVIGNISTLVANLDTAKSEYKAKMVDSMCESSASLVGGLVGPLAGWWVSSSCICLDVNHMASL